MTHSICYAKLYPQPCSRPAILWLSLLTLIVPVPAQAHLLSTGFGRFLDGMLHPLASITELLILLGSLLFLGQQSPRWARWGLMVIPLSYAGGFAVGHLVGVPTAELALMVSTVVIMLLGLLVAIRPALGLGHIWSVVAGALVINGWMMTEVSIPPLALTGTLVTFFLLSSIGPALVIVANRGWGAIAIRALGSWVASISFLGLSWLIA